MAWNDPEEFNLNDLKHPLDAEDFLVGDEFDDDDYPYYDVDDLEFIVSDDGE